MNQLVEPERIDLTSVVPDKARPDMFEKIGQPGIVITDEKGPVGPALRFSLVGFPVIGYIISEQPTPEG